VFEFSVQSYAADKEKDDVGTDEQQRRIWELREK